MRNGILEALAQAAPAPEEYDECKELWQPPKNRFENKFISRLDKMLKILQDEHAIKVS